MSPAQKQSRTPNFVRQAKVPSPKVGCDRWPVWVCVCVCVPPCSVWQEKETFRLWNVGHNLPATRKSYKAAHRKDVAAISGMQCVSACHRTKIHTKCVCVWVLWSCISGRRINRIKKVDTWCRFLFPWCDCKPHTVIIWDAFSRPRHAIALPSRPCLLHIFLLAVF